jgi:hypothetical protein
MARTKIPVSLRLDPEIKAAGEQRAKKEMRSFASYLEWLIAEDVKRQSSADTVRTLARPAMAVPKRKG